MHTFIKVPDGYFYRCPHCEGHGYFFRPQTEFDAWSYRWPDTDDAADDAEAIRAELRVVLEQKNEARS